MIETPTVSSSRETSKATAKKRPLTVSKTTRGSVIWSFTRFACGVEKNAPSVCCRRSCGVAPVVDQTATDVLTASMIEPGPAASCTSAGLTPTDCVESRPASVVSGAAGAGVGGAAEADGTAASTTTHAATTALTEEDLTNER